MGATRRETIELSPRQRQVVEMIAAGRTNPEIADALGISLQGAKWHVSEVLARFGVSTREEAAEAWRRQHHLRERVARGVAGLFGAGTVKVGLAGTAVVAAAAGAVLVVAAMRDSAVPETPTPPDSAAALQVSKMSRAEAEAHARYAAGEYLRMTDIPQKVTVNGHPISGEDLDMAELKFVPADTDPATYYSTNYPSDKDSWVATFRREDVPMPDMGWSDGIVNVTIRFDDSNGKVIGAAAGSTNPRLETLPAPPFSLPDASGRERVTPFYEVMRVEADGGARTISVYGTKDGSWCWTHSNANGSGGGSCGLDGPTAEHPHVFSLSGTGTGAVQSERVASMRYGATSGEAARVSLTYASGEAVEAETIPSPSELGRPWRAFAVIEPEGHSVLREVVAFDAAGSELERFELPQAISVPPYVVEPLAAIAFSGADAATGGDFELPPPAFPVNIRLAVEYEGDVTATVVCDTGKTPIVEAGERAAFVEEEAPGTFLLLMPPEARKCRFEVSGRGAWSFRSH